MGRVLRQGLRIRLEGEHGVGGRERAEVPLADGRGDVGEFLLRHPAQAVREVPRQDREILRVRGERVVEIPIFARVELAGLIAFDESAGLVVVFQQ